LSTQQSQVIQTHPGVAHLSFDNEIEALARLRTFIDYLPLSNRHPVPVKPCTDKAARDDTFLDTAIPWHSNKAYDMNEIIKHVVDTHSFFEVSPEFAKNIVTGFKR
jgi:propionyl-CoA carboxylase beta chain